MYKVAALFLLLLGSYTEAARILGLSPTPARSHSRVHETLLVELAARGHHVTYASAVPAQLPLRNSSSGGSFTFILLEGAEELLSNMDAVVGPDRYPLAESFMLWHVAPLICERQLASKGLQPLLTDESITFDLVMVEVFYFDCMVPFARKFNAPLMGFTSFWPPPWGHAMLGNPDPTATSPNFFLPYGDQMGFFERVHNSIHTAVVMFLRRWLFLPQQDKVVRQVFGRNTPPLRELEAEAVMLLSNTHPVINFPHANVPSLVEVGGMHIQPAKSLPQDLLKFLDNASQGVVVFSLGSMINEENLPSDRLQLLTDTMAALPCAVLWRWDTANVPGLPANVRVESWMPQRDVLAHPNVKLLVTHGGLLSAQEAAFEGVPRLVLPFFGDQHMNALRAVQLGVGLALNFYRARPENLINAATEILSNPSYREAAKQLALEFHDQPETPLERAVFWTEYVLRHQGASHLRSAATQLAWYQIHLLDVAAFVLGTLLMFVLVLRALFKLWRGNKPTTTTTDKKKKKKQQ